MSATTATSSYLFLFLFLFLFLDVKSWLISCTIYISFVLLLFLSSQVYIVVSPVLHDRDKAIHFQHTSQCYKQVWKRVPGKKGYEGGTLHKMSWIFKTRLADIVAFSNKTGFKQDKDTVATLLALFFTPVQWVSGSVGQSINRSVATRVASLF